MKRWVPRCRACFFINRGSKRLLSTYTHEQVQVRTGSVGYVSIDLFNISKHAPESPLIVHLPPLPAQGGTPSAAPSFLQNDFPIASINYRWEHSLSDAAPSEDVVRPLCWPAPVHDVAFAFAWLVDNLAPPGNSRRDMYVYGSHLGASLGASLGLTEAHSNARFGIRGFVAHNGVYNWTMFLPDHRVNQRPRRAKRATAPMETAIGERMVSFRDQLRFLFEKPSNLFDPFASPSLFFHGPGVDIPKTFNMSTTELMQIDALVQHASSGDTLSLLNPPKPPRKSHYVFPPRRSTLKIPHALLLHDAAPLSLTSSGKTQKRRTRVGNTLETQAQELADFMRRSIDKVELKERVKWDDDMDTWEQEAKQRVQVLELRDECEGHAVSSQGEEAILEWLSSR